MEVETGVVVVVGGKGFVLEVERVEVVAGAGVVVDG